ncbi:hypothetical protein HPP92_021734 [Vanilla planifolia]|uniref:RING-type E3 ubiquitin transferase n=1 Tax=Vanilla planifolia TaxID=51239 RepID=A0A835UGK1_VANPL|nr:hypothetical protein HPP92_027619 [Vanilla planifolia]KAG0458606.1 hypothetical protein HPP92_021734 [Vanilla planifolia]
MSGNEYLTAPLDPLLYGQPPSWGPTVALRPSQSPTVVTALVSGVALLLLGSFVILACHWFSKPHSPAIPPSAGRLQGVRTLDRRPSPAQGLASWVVASLPVVRGGGGSACAVCLGEYEEGEAVKVMPSCGHAFHPACIDTWLVSRGSCPLCRCSELWGPGGGQEVRVNVGGAEGVDLAREGGGSESARRSCSNGEERAVTVFQQRSGSA